MSHETLIEVVCTLTQDNKPAKTRLVNQFLLTSEDILKTIEKEYRKKSKSTRFYDYRETDVFFNELRTEIASLFEKWFSRHLKNQNRLFI